MDGVWKEREKERNKILRISNDIALCLLYSLPTAKYTDTAFNYKQSFFNRTNSPDLKKMRLKHV